MRTAVACLVVMMIAGSSALPATAGFRVCNQTLDLLNVAIGTVDASDFGTTEGWWVVTANSCAELIREELSSQYIYLFASNVQGDGIVTGVVPMCVGRKKFKILGTDDCYLRGYDQANFKEIDTVTAPDWTVFVMR